MRMLVYFLLLYVGFIESLLGMYSQDRSSTGKIPTSEILQPTPPKTRNGSSRSQSIRPSTGGKVCSKGLLRLRGVSLPRSNQKKPFSEESSQKELGTPSRRAGITAIGGMVPLTLTPYSGDSIRSPIQFQLNVFTPQPPSPYREKNLHLLVRTGRIDEMRELLKEASLDQSKVLTNKRDAFGMSPLRTALLSTPIRLDAVELLFEAGADPETLDDEGFHPLQMALVNFPRKVSLALVELFLNAVKRCAIARGDHPYWVVADYLDFLGKVPIDFEVMDTDVVRLLNLIHGSYSVHYDQYRRVLQAGTDDDKKRFLYKLLKNSDRESAHKLIPLMESLFTCGVDVFEVVPFYAGSLLHCALRADVPLKEILIFLVNVAKEKAVKFGQDSVAVVQEFLNRKNRFGLTALRIAELRVGHPGAEDLGDYGQELVEVLEALSKQ